MYSSLKQMSIDGTNVVTHVPKCTVFDATHRNINGSQIAPQLPLTYKVAVPIRRLSVQVWRWRFGEKHVVFLSSQLSYIRDLVEVFDFRE